MIKSKKHGSGPESNFCGGFFVTLVRTIIINGTSLGIFFNTSDNNVRITDTYDSQKAWFAFNSCVDDYTAISEDQLADMKTMSSFASITVALAVLILLV